MLDEQLVENVRESYGRCNLSKGFYNDFYNTFFAKSDEIKKKFANTNMEGQKEALRFGLGFMILYSRDHHTAVRKMQQIAEIHDQKHHDIRPDLYPFWTEALLETVSKHDKDFNDKLKKQWQEVLDNGIKLFLSKYEVK